MKKILIDLRAIGRPIDSICPVANINGHRNIMTDDLAGLIRDVTDLIDGQFGGQAAHDLFGCDWDASRLPVTAKDFLFGCNMSTEAFTSAAEQFIRDFKPAASPCMAPDESRATDNWLVCRAQTGGFCLSDSDGCILARSVPDSMLSDIRNGGCSEYAILTIPERS